MESASINNFHVHNVSVRSEGSVHYQVDSSDLGNYQSMQSGLSEPCQPRLFSVLFILLVSTSPE